MESQSPEHKDEAPKTKELIREIQKKAEELLEQDGKSIKFRRDFSPSLVASYKLDVPTQIGGMKTISPQAQPENLTAKLVINRTPAAGKPRDIILLLGILDRDLEDATFTLALKKERPPSFQYHQRPREVGGNRFVVREARKSDLEDFLKILQGELYVISPENI